MANTSKGRALYLKLRGYAMSEELTPDIFYKGRFTHEEMIDLQRYMDQRLKRQARNLTKLGFGRTTLVKDIRSATKNPKSVNEAAMAWKARVLEQKRGTKVYQETIKQHRLEGFADAGMDYVNEDNYWDFIDYMDEKKESELGTMYNSDQIADAYTIWETAKPKDFEKEFEFYSKNSDLIRALGVTKFKNAKQAATAIRRAKKKRERERGR